MRGLFRTSFVAVLLAGVVLVVDVGSDVVSTDASASIGGLSVSSVAVAPRVVSAVAGDGFAQVTIADMSPDTGVYAVQWVSAGQSFNSFSMYRTTSKTMTVPYLACTRSYTLRVFVMAADWLLADGHQTQNVTPHSQTFDLTMPACVSTAPGVSALTCAQGGACIVGNTGPGGGKVFYVQAGGGTFTCGATLASTCKYLEAAPTTGTNAWTDAFYAWSGNTTVLIGVTAQGTAVGSGYKNTVAMVTQSAGGNTASRAGTIARAYGGPNNLSDWYLPSKDELNQLYLNKTTVGFSPDYYWSSSEGAVDGAWGRNFLNGNQGNGAKSNPYYVRPVRAFG